MPPRYTIVAFSHLRWNFVYQRPQHLLSRLAAGHPVFFIEEPELDLDGEIRFERSSPQPNITVLRPRTPIRAPGFNAGQIAALRPLIAELATELGESSVLAWLYTPLALPLAEELEPNAMVYDCMDELSLFKGAPPELLSQESRLLELADVMFTGGPSLYRAKQARHHNVYCFPSSVDAAHFREGRSGPSAASEAEDQAGIAHPRLGFYGVIDERLDLPLIAGLARSRPDWHIILVGPVIKVDPSVLPQAANICYLGPKRYEELPTYVAGWDVAVMPFARNEATLFISPTKTPEYLAAGKPVVSTSIRDVVRAYGESGMVRIADTVDAFVSAVEQSMRDDAAARIMRIDEHLKDQSWDHTWSRIEALMAESTARAALR